MATEVQIGGDGALFVGEDKIVYIEVLDVNGLPVNVTAMAFLFDVRLKDNSPAPAIFSKVPTVTGVYNAVRATNTQRLAVTFTDDELNTVTNKTYRHSCKRTDNGSETVIIYGPIIFQKATNP